MFIEFKDILKTFIDVDGIKVIWRDEEDATLDNGEEITIYRIYYSYGHAIFVLEYIEENLRDIDFDKIKRGDIK